MPTSVGMSFIPSPMVGYPLLIILIVTVHYLFIAAAVFGGLAVLRRPWLALIHIPIFVWAGLVVFTTWGCPLTALEKSLRVHAGLASYRGGFLNQYVDPGLGALGMSGLVPYLGYLVLGLNIGLYAVLIAHYRFKSTGTDGAVD